jgi:thioredoxin 1
MATVELTSENFEKYVTEPGVTMLVDLWAGWCKPCLQFSPIFEASSENHPDITFGKIDTEAQKELAAAAGVTSIPTLMAFRDGMLVYSQAGAIPSEKLETLISQIEAIDMDDVKKRLNQN